MHLHIKTDRNSFIHSFCTNNQKYKGKNWTIEFKWVKAHAGIYGNEIADRLAKEATQNCYVTYSRTPKSVIKKDTRKESIRNWRSQWEETTKGAITKGFFSKCRK